MSCLSAKYLRTENFWRDLGSESGRLTKGRLTEGRFVCVIS